MSEPTIATSHPLSLRDRESGPAHAHGPSWTNSGLSGSPSYQQTAPPQAGSFTLAAEAVTGAAVTRTATILTTISSFLITDRPFEIIRPI